MLAPDVDLENESYKAECFEQIPEYEDKNFWFEARNRMIAWGIGRFFPNASRFLEVGCGNAIVLKAIHECYPNMRIVGADVFTASLATARHHFDLPTYWQLDARCMPLAEEFDIIGAFDVIEHIQEDTTVLRQMRDALVPGGGILVTVPQHPFLWGPRDEYLCHVRRYTRRELASKVKAAGFRILSITSFITVPFPAMILTNARDRWLTRRYDPFDDLNQGKITNSILNTALVAEFQVIRLGINLPFGGSLFLAARKC